MLSPNTQKSCIVTRHDTWFNRYRIESKLCYSLHVYIIFLPLSKSSKRLDSGFRRHMSCEKRFWGTATGKLLLFQRKRKLSVKYHRELASTWPIHFISWSIVGCLNPLVGSYAFCHEKQNACKCRNIHDLSILVIYNLKFPRNFEQFYQFLTHFFPTIKQCSHYSVFSQLYSYNLNHDEQTIVQVRLIRLASELRFILPEALFTQHHTTNECKTASRLDTTPRSCLRVIDLYTNRLRCPRVNILCPEWKQHSMTTLNS